MKYLFDTNSVIYYLEGKGCFPKLSNHDEYIISFITKIELLCGDVTGEEKDLITSFIKNFEVVMVDDNIINKTIDIRVTHKLKLPDSLIVATSIIKESILITADKKISNKDLGFEIINPLIAKS